MSKNIGYHTRLWADNTVKVVGGSFGGAIDMETVNRLMRLFEVAVKPSGSPVLVDREGREVRLYLSVDVESTEKGKLAMKAWHAEQTMLAEKAEADAEARAEDLERAMAGLSHEEILARLARPA